MCDHAFVLFFAKHNSIFMHTVNELFQHIWSYDPHSSIIETTLSHSIHLRFYFALKQTVPSKRPIIFDYSCIRAKCLRNDINDLEFSASAYFDANAIKIFCFVH